MLTWAANENKPTLPSGGNTGTDPSARSRSNSASAAIGEVINLPCALRKIKLQAGLSDQRDTPGLKILKRVKQIEHITAPAGQFSDKNDVNITSLAMQGLFPFSPRIFRTRGGFLLDPNDLAGLLGEGSKIPFLQVAGLVGC